MKLSNIKVYHWFWIVTVIIVIIGFFQSYNNPDSVIDINVHDTYYVISDYYFSLLLIIIYFLFGLGYWLVIEVFKRKLVRVLTLIHSVIFIGGFVVYWVAYGYDIIQKERLGILHDFAFLNQVLLVLFLLMLIATPIYFINLVIGIFRKANVKL